MPRVVVLNSYDIAHAWREVDRGLMPDQFLYGLNHIARAGYDVIVPERPLGPGPSRARAMAAVRRLPIPLGDPALQRSVLRAARGADLIYVPCGQADMALVAYLRAAGVVRAPVVCVLHHPIDAGRLAGPRRPLVRAILRGLDAAPALSEHVAADLRARRPGQPGGVLRWGPDAVFYPTAPGPETGVVAAGKMDRDFQTLAAAATAAAIQTKIICSPRDAPTAAVRSASVSVEFVGDDWAYGWPALLADYAAARVIAIPLSIRASVPLRGLSSLLDAMAMGRPVVMTRHPGIDLDPQALGFGFTVEPNDAAGWAVALTRLTEDPSLAAAMGSRGRQLVDDGLNSAAFAEQVLAVFASVLAA